MRYVHFPVWLGAAATTGNPALVILFMLETFTRAILITVVPLHALALLGDAQSVSVFYFLVSGTGLLGTLAVPWLVRRLRRTSGESTRPRMAASASGSSTSRPK